MIKIFTIIIYVVTGVASISSLEKLCGQKMTTMGGIVFAATWPIPLVKKLFGDDVCEANRFDPDI